MVLIVMTSSDAKLYLPSWRWVVDEVDDCRSPPIFLTYIPIVLQTEGSSLVRHGQTVLSISVQNPTTKEGMCSLGYFKAVVVSFSWYLRVGFTMAYSGEVEVLWMIEEGCG